MIYDKPIDINFSVLPGKVRKKHAKKEKQNINKILALKIGAFFLTLYVGATVSFIIPLRPSYSESEKRELKEFPKISCKAVLSGSYFDDISTWFSDTFPFREQLTKFNTSIKKLSGFDSIAIHGDVDLGDEIPDAPLDVPVTDPPETTSPPETTLPPETTEAQDEPKPDIKTQSLGAILVAGNSAYEYYNFSSKLAPDFINCVNSIKGAAENKSNVYSLLIPTSMDITLHDSIRKDINSSDQKKALDYFNSSFKNVTAVSGIYEAEKAHKNEYTYFRTDHHWTALGAYYAYEEFAKAKGISPVPISDYATVSFDGFLGTFYSSSGQSDALGKTPDTVTAYLPNNNVECTLTEESGKTYSWDVISDVTNYAQNLKYLTFIGGDQALVTIKNLDIQDGSTCLVIKESYGNAFVPFLIPHYENIYVIDPRHYSGTLSEFASNKEIDDIIFLANISTTRNSIYIDAMKGFIK
ncbi:MAG: DHHW family protein [Acutalibacteraceae bacterium]